MTNYPVTIDNDKTIIRIDDNLSELGSLVINQLRDAVFAIQKTLGVNPHGSRSSVAERISILIGPDGNPRAEALQAVGLASLPISDVQVAANAGIKEYKLDLNFPTADLNTNITAAQTQLSLVQGLITEENANLLTHISGGNFFVDGITRARHVASHIDINAVPIDPRDTYSWTGLLDIDGYQRPVTQVAQALLEINNELIEHENATTTLIHPASAISIDTNEFTQFPSFLSSVQEVFEYIDDQEALSIGVDRATLNSNGIPKSARIQSLQNDGYTINVVPVTKVHAYLAEPNQLAPNDNINSGDDIVRFFPDNSNFVFDAAFTKVRVGDILRINYGNGIEARYPIVGVRFLANSDWAVRVNANNLFNAADGYDGYARIDRANFDSDTWGVFATAGVVTNVNTNNQSVNSIIIGNPRGAVAVGIGFDPNQIDENHYNLYLRIYPNGDPKIFQDLPAVDVSGNLGTTPGYYNLDIIVENTNKKFRSAGYNYRFIAFNQKGEFGIMLADDYNGAAFSIISGQVNSSSGTLEVGSFAKNIIGDATDRYDALGLGFSRAGFATPIISRSGSNIPYPTAISAANYSTLIIYPVSNRNVIVNGNRRDSLAKPRFTEGDGYWIATVSNVTTDVPNNTIRVTYAIPLELATEDFTPGKTIVVQPIIPTDPIIKHYGRFVIDAVAFSCVGAGETDITVLNSIHGTANSSDSTLSVGDRVKIYFSDDSVMFNMGNMAGGDSSNDPLDYHHYHEVFLNYKGESFAVERARIPHSDSGSIPSLSGSGNIGSLAGWRIRRVSPKLRGYRSGTTDFRYFVWLRITNYDAGTGEFDIYLFSLDFASHGPVTKGKRNNPVRVYDESYINFIDIEFREEALNPGTTIPTGWVAVELFPTLKEHGEYFAIAGVSHNGLVFKSVTDLREFGTVSEKNFTDSAIKFIESGERYIHTNGIVKGLSWKSFGISNYTLNFNGGIALVNGSFVPIDATSINLPVLNTASDLVEYFICVTETGQLRSVLKSNETIFFDSINNNFVESLTFKEIVNKRKDLTIIAKARVVISEGAVIVTDARRHITNQDTAGTYSWAYSSPGIYGIDNSNKHNASFITEESLMNWVNEYGVEEVIVKEVVLNSSINLNFTSPVVLKGGIYRINNFYGLNFTSGNWKIDGAEIFYTPVIGGSFDNGDNFNIKSNWGAILINLGLILNATISDFGIENSRFHCDMAQRPPFVGIYSAYGSSYNIFERGKFTNNSFIDSLADKALCYAFINGNTPNISTSAPYFSDILVSETKVNLRQGILVSGRATENPAPGHGYTSMNVVLVENFIIKDNHFGLIGFNVSNWIGEVESGRFVVESNKCDLILSGVTATMHSTDLTFSATTNTFTGTSCSFLVSKNDCYFMKIEESGGSNQLKSIISENNIYFRDRILLDAIVPDPVPWAMVILSPSLYPTNVKISDNVIDGLDNGYYHNIYVSGAGASITGNIINNIKGGEDPMDQGWGIWNSSTTINEQTTIVGNTLNKKDGEQIAGFIYSTANASIYGNNLSDFNLAFWSNGGTDYFDGYGDTTTSSFNGISGPGANFAAWNVNQVVRTVPNLASAIPLYHITPVSGTVITNTENNERLLHGIPGSNQYINKGLSKVIFNESNGWVWEWNGGGLAGNDGTVGLIIPLSSVLPDRAYLLSFAIDISFSGPWDVYANGGADTNTFPQVSLELNGNMVRNANPFYPTFQSTVTLHYQSEALITGTRPPAPLIKEIVVKMKQGVIEPNSVNFGGWLGPTAAGRTTLTIRQPWITYMY